MHWEYIAGGLIVLVLLVQLILLVKEELKYPTHIKDSNKKQDTTSDEENISRD